jgi:glycosyltransferase involved in cell wall biosynthesis
VRIALFYHADPAGHVPGGIDSFIRGLLKWAPRDLHYTLFGATSDEAARPVGREAKLPFHNDNAKFIPLITINSLGRRAVVPNTLRYVYELSRYAARGRLVDFDALDFHRVEPMWLFKRDRRPKNIVIHTDMAMIRGKRSDVMWRHAPWLYDSIERHLIPDAERIFIVNRSVAQRYRSVYPEMAAKISFLPTWVDTKVFSPCRSLDERNRLCSAFRAKLGLTSSSTRILVFVGRLDIVKDPLLLLEAFRESIRTRPDLHLVIIGDGVLRQNVERACLKSELNGHVTLLGVMQPSDIADVLRASDLFVLSSVYEGMPIAALEALASGLPVVSTNVGEIPLVVKNGVTGQISVDRTSKSLADAICAALEAIDQMTGKPCEKAVESYHPEKVLGLLYDNHRAQAKLIAGTN